MSRPPAVHQQPNIGSAFNQPVIDFVNKGYPSGYPVGSAYAPSYAPSYEAYQPSIYAQAGYPGYAMPARLCDDYQVYQPPANYVPPPQYPAYEQGMSQNVGARETEDQLREKINSKIDAIIEAQRASTKDQRADQLSSQIERLTRKVQKLSSALERESPRAEAKLSSGLSSDADVADRLRSLAEESKKAMGRSRKVPDW